MHLVDILSIYLRCGDLFFKELKKLSREGDI